MGPIERRLRRIENVLVSVQNEILKNRRLIMATWEEVKAAAGRQDTVQMSVLAFIAGLKQKLDDMQKPGGPSEAEFQAVIDELDANAGKYASAVVDNTPAEGEPAPEPGTEPAPSV